MELLPLDGTFVPTKIYESYSSLIWTERYSQYGDFELVSSDIANCIASFPRESYVAIRESTVPMVVEDHQIINKPNEAPAVKITGRSFDSVLDRRGSVNSLPSAAARASWTITAAKESDAAYKAMRVVMGDVARLRTDNSQPLASEVALGTTVLPAISPAVDFRDAIPEINLVLPKDYSSLTPNSYEIEANDLYTAVTNLLKINGHGLKATRPDVVTQPGKTTVDLEIYNGADLTSIVSFDARFDQFDSSTYLFTEQTSKNVGYIYGPNGSNKVLKTAATEPTGLGRRVLLVDETGDDTLNSSTIRTSRGLIELYKNNAIALFDGEVAAQVAKQYNQTYFLGDIILLVGEYNLSNAVRVAEFIRSSDASGEKAYPTFEVVA